MLHLVDSRRYLQMIQKRRLNELHPHSRRDIWIAVQRWAGHRDRWIKSDFISQFLCMSDTWLVRSEEAMTGGIYYFYNPVTQGTVTRWGPGVVGWWGCGKRVRDGGRNIFPAILRGRPVDEILHQFPAKDSWQNLDVIFRHSWRVYLIQVVFPLFRNKGRWRSRFNCWNTPPVIH